MSSSKPLIIILSCKKNICRHQIYRKYLIKNDAKYLFVVGGYKKTQIVDDILQVNVDDDYASLAKKIAKTYVFLYKNFKNISILKIDDDTIINLNNFKKIKFSFDYAGFFAKGKYKNLDYCFAYGGGYYLSNKSLSLFVNNYKKYITVMTHQEDRLVGLSLSSKKQNLKIANFGKILDKKNLELFSSLNDTILHPMRIEQIKKFYESKLKNFYYIIPKGFMLPNPPEPP